MAFFWLELGTHLNETIHYQMQKFHKNQSECLWDIPPVHPYYKLLADVLWLVLCLFSLSVMWLKGHQKLTNTINKELGTCKTNCFSRLLSIHYFI
jgi:hypothetical protein